MLAGRRASNHWFPASHFRAGPDAAACLGQSSACPLLSGELGFFIFKNKFLVLVFGGKKLATLQVGNPSGISQVKPPLRGRDLWTPSLPLHRTATQEVLVPCSSEHPKHSAHALWNIVLLWRMEQIHFLWRAGPEPKGFKWQQGRFGWIKGRKNHSTVDGLPRKVSPPGLEVLKLMLMASQLSGCCSGQAVLAGLALSGPAGHPPSHARAVSGFGGGASSPLDGGLTAPTLLLAVALQKVIKTAQAEAPA